MLQFFLENGVELNKFHYFGKTPLQVAISRQDIEIAKFLILAGANINQKDTYGNCPLKLAKMLDLHELLKFLKEKEGDSSLKPKLRSFQHDSFSFQYPMDWIKTPLLPGELLSLNAPGSFPALRVRINDMNELSLTQTSSILQNYFKTFGKDVVIFSEKEMELTRGN